MSLLMVREMITSCISFYMARKLDYASVGKRSTSRPGWEPLFLLGQKVLDVPHPSLRLD